MKLTLALSALLLVTGCVSPQYAYYDPQPVYVNRPVYVQPRPVYVQPRCYWTQTYVPQYNAYRSVRVCR